MTLVHPYRALRDWPMHAALENASLEHDEVEPDEVVPCAVLVLVAHPVPGTAISAQREEGPRPVPEREGRVS